MPTEYDEVLGYDADHEDPAQYCPHGVWIGSWWGPDYLCMWCEDGISPKEMEYICWRRALRMNVETIKRYRHLHSILTAGEFQASVATYVTTIISNSAEVEEAITRLAHLNAHRP